MHIFTSETKTNPPFMNSIDINLPVSVQRSNKGIQQVSESHRKNTSNHWRFRISHEASCRYNNVTVTIANTFNVSDTANRHILSGNNTKLSVSYSQSVVIPACKYADLFNHTMLIITPPSCNVTSWLYLDIFMSARNQCKNVIGLNKLLRFNGTR